MSNGYVSWRLKGGISRGPVDSSASVSQGFLATCQLEGQRTDCLILRITQDFLQIVCGTTPTYESPPALLFHECVSS